MGGCIEAVSLPGVAPWDTGTRICLLPVPVHQRFQKSGRESMGNFQAPPPPLPKAPGRTWTHLANGEGGFPPLCRPDTEQRKKGHCRGSVGTTSQGKGRVSRIGQAGRGRVQGGERPMACGEGGFKEQGKGKGEWREANRRRQLQTALHPGIMPDPTPPPSKY